MAMYVGVKLMALGCLCVKIFSLPDNFLRIFSALPTCGHSVSYLGIFTLCVFI